MKRATTKPLALMCIQLLWIHSIVARPLLDADEDDRSAAITTSSNSAANSPSMMNLIRSPPTNVEGVEAIYERLKLGDAEAWRQYGSEVVDVVSELVDEGLADDPFDALLVLFYPNLSPQERHEALTKFEPLLRKLTQQQQEQRSLVDESPIDDEITLYKKDSAEATSDDGEIDDEQLRDALRQLRIQPSESLTNLDTVHGKKRPPTRRTDQQQQSSDDGQKETPMYLGTHESPEGISWRV